MFTFSASWIVIFSVNFIRNEFNPFYCGSRQAYTVQAEWLSTWLPGEQELGDSCGHGEEDGDGCDGDDGSHGDDSRGILVLMVMVVMEMVVMVIVMMAVVEIVMMVCNTLKSKLVVRSLRVTYFLLGCLTRKQPYF